MSHPQVIEGTWDEVSSQLASKAEEFRAYGKLRMIILPDEAPREAEKDGEEPTLAEMLAGRTGRFHFGEANLSEDSGKKFAALLSKKRKEGHL